MNRGLRPPFGENMGQVVGPNEVQAGKAIKFFLDPGLDLFVSGKWTALNGTLRGEGQFAEINTTLDMAGALLDITFEWIDNRGQVGFASKTAQIINDPFKDAHVWYEYSNDYYANSVYGNDWKFQMGTNIPSPYTITREYYQTLPGGTRWGPYKNISNSFTVDVRSGQAYQGLNTVEIKTIITKDGVSKEFNDICYGIINSRPADNLVSLDIKTEDDNKTFKVNELIEATPSIKSTSEKIYSTRYVWELKKGTAFYDKMSTVNFSESVHESGDFILYCRALFTDVENLNNSFVKVASIPIKVTKITDWIPSVRFIGQNGHTSGVEWGPLDAMQINAFVSNGDKLISDIGVLAGSVSTYVDGTELTSAGQVMSLELMNQRASAIGTHRVKFKGKAGSVTSSGMPVQNGVYGLVDFESQEYPYSVNKLSKLTTHSMAINGVSIKDNLHPIDLAGPPGKEFTFQCTINLEAPNTTVGVNNDLKQLATKGVFSLIDYKGDVVIESPTGAGTIKWVFPSETKTLIGKLRWTCTDPSVVAPMVYENDLRINVYQDLPEVMPVLTLTQSPKPAIIDSQVDVIAAVDKGTVSNIKWNDISASSMIHTTMAARNKKITFSCVVKLDGYDPINMYQEYTLDVVGKSWDGIDIELVAASDKVPYAQNVEITPVIVNKASAAPISGLTWYQDDVEIQSQSPNKLIFQTRKVGQHKYKCEATVINADFEPQTKTFVKEIDIETVNAEIKSRCFISPKPLTIKIDEPLPYAVTVQGEPAGSTFTYEWKVDDEVVSTESSYEFKGTEKKRYTVSVSVKIENTGYDSVTVADTTTVDVVDELPLPGDSIRYVHPLPHRHAGFIWCGYWALDEIQKAVKAGIDWRRPDESGMKYTLDLRTIADMIVRYPEVEIQESRNGYIINKQQIETGFIYNKPFD